MCVPYHYHDNPNIPSSLAQHIRPVNLNMPNIISFIRAYSAFPRQSKHIKHHLVHLQASEIFMYTISCGRDRSAHLPALSWLHSDTNDADVCHEMVNSGYFTNAWFQLSGFRMMAMRTRGQLFLSAPTKCGSRDVETWGVIVDNILLGPIFLHRVPSAHGVGLICTWTMLYRFEKHHFGVDYVRRFLVADQLIHL